MPDSNTLSLCIQCKDPHNLVPEWVEHRAHKLNLSGWIAQPGRGTLIVSVTGNTTMLEAFKVACSLGPISASVTGIEVIDDGKLAETDPICTF